MKDDEEELKTFLNELSQKIYADTNRKDEKKKQRSIIDNYSFRHVDLVFFDNEKTIERYLKILNLFFR